jgi:hypothetical protein
MAENRLVAAIVAPLDSDSPASLFLMKRTVDNSKLIALEAHVVQLRILGLYEITEAAKAAITLITTGRCPS